MPTDHPIARYRAQHVLAQRWLAQPNDISPHTLPAMTLGGNWCITLADETINGDPMRPSDGAHIVCDFVGEEVAQAIVAQHNERLA